MREKNNQQTDNQQHNNQNNNQKIPQFEINKFYSYYKTEKAKDGKKCNIFINDKKFRKF